MQQANCRRFFPAESSHEHLLSPENVRRQQQSSEAEDHPITRTNRWSRISTIPNWRWSRSMLEPESLAIFQPLSHDVPQLNLGGVPTEEKSSSFGYEGKVIAEEKDLKADSFDRDLSTRNLCIVALIAGISLGAISLTLGVRIVASGKVLLPSFLLGKYVNIQNLFYPFPTKTAKHYFTGHRIFNIPGPAVLSASLALNVLLTILFDSMNYIQKCTLRWALWREGRLQYNSNPRLFASARQYAPNSWYMNVVACIALILGYGSASTLTSNVYMTGFSDARGHLITPADPQGWALDINGWCLAGLGIALLLQGLICSWCLVRSQHVPTWSSNPLNTARVCSINASDILAPSSSQKLSYQQGKGSITPFTSRSSTLLSDGSRLPKTHGGFLAVPLSRQPPMKLLVSHSKHFTRTIWAILFLVSLWAIVVGALARQADTCSADYVREASLAYDFLGVWQNYCQIVTKTWGNAYTGRRDWLGLLIHTIALAIITLGLHCAEVLTEMTRDEAIWREATTRGADPAVGSLTQGALSWQCWILVIFKCVVPWIFSYALDTALSVVMSLLPILTIAVLFLWLGLLAEFLIRHKPKGPQPATYGNVEALAALIDEWHDSKIFWGDKGAVTEMVRRAGTSGQRLADLQMSFLYQGIRG